MGKLQVAVRLSRDGKRGKVVQAIVDSGSDLTLFPRTVAAMLRLRRPPGTETEDVAIMGRTLRVWFTHLDVQIPDTDCLAERFPVGFVDKGRDSVDDLLHGIIGADFLQATGGLLDFGRNRHAIAGDPEARGEHSDAPVIARRKRLPRRAR